MPTPLLHRAFARRDRLYLYSVLVLSNAASLAMLAFRAFYGGTVGYSLFLWNLFLALIPMFLAVAIDRLHARNAGGGRGAAAPRLLALGFLWLLFFPNAPYLLTEFIHLHPSHPVRDHALPDWLLGFSLGRGSVPLWYDVILILSFAWNGMLLGFVSLYLVQRAVGNLAGRRWAWATAVGVLVLSAFGISIGRFQRFNSWDVFSRPHVLLRDVAGRLLNPLDHPTTTATTILFATFLVLAYLAIFALMHMHKDGNGGPSGAGAA